MLAVDLEFLLFLDWQLESTESGLALPLSSSERSEFDKIDVSAATMSLCDSNPVSVEPWFSEFIANEMLALTRVVLSVGRSKC